MRRVVPLGQAMRPMLLASETRPNAKTSEETLVEIDGTVRSLLAMLLDEIEASDDAPNQTLLREVRDLLEEQRSAELEDHFGDACLTGRNQTSPDELPGALVLYPILLEDRVAILTGHEGFLRYTRAPISTESLRDETRRLRHLLEKRTTRQFIRPAQTLYDALIRPLADDLPRDGVDTLVVVPDGPLRTIPFAALYDRETQRFLIDRIAVAVVPSLRLTEPGPIDAEDIRVLAAGIGVAIGGFERLEFTRQEIDGIAARFPSRVLFDESFEVDALEEALRKRPYSIVHVATHGRFAEGDDDSFLLAYDGRLGLKRMTEIIATTRFRRERPLELLTLSACESAARRRARRARAGRRRSPGSAREARWRLSGPSTTKPRHD